LKFLSIITGRPVVVTLYVLTLFLWSAVFFYLVPKATGGWFAWTVSIAFGALSVAPMLVFGATAAWRTVRGVPLHSDQSGVCPHCGRPYNRESGESAAQ
jgi:hypothetical protein